LEQIAIRMKNITKSFGSVRANHQLSLDIHRGEILALLGENGSGKTTLMNMLAGIYYPDEGQIFVNGHEVSIRSPKDAIDLGIGMVHQHFKLVDIFTATENVMLGLSEKGKFDKKATAQKIRDICRLYGFDIDPNQKVYNMTVSQKQTLEIMKVLYRGAEILILDEPTAVLTPAETEKLFAILKNMKTHGKSIVIITHKLHEVLSVSDKVAILRKGEHVATVPTAEATELSLTEMMVGKKVALDIDRPAPPHTTDRIVVQHLSCHNHEGAQILRDITFTAKGGEILGIAGISGNGQKELLEAIAGLQIPDAGSSILYYPPGGESPKELIGKSPRQIRDLGIALSFVPEDRLGMGLVASMGMTGNMMVKDYDAAPSFFIRRAQPRQKAEQIKEQLAIVTPGVQTPVSRLSGGNVQKVLVGRELAAEPAVLMTVYAVRGLDINTSLTIYRLLNEQKQKGVAVIYVGEDLDVLIALCDRIMVLCGGQVSGMVEGRHTTKEEIGYLMTKLRKGEGHDTTHTQA